MSVSEKRKLIKKKKRNNNSHRELVIIGMNHHNMPNTFQIKDTDHGQWGTGAMTIEHLFALQNCPLTPDCRWRLRQQC
ncbi:hypothetical protein PoB_004347200 [Plakobranchus ocellatus]|uniref:Uncharacterized protein n=1 Tax=Plakobranchus ocellatus TaxID=259542 RepID=A0AAV4BDD1_9GAST|nr:hypothetical protein PoB_004347200 [Plakobranchus ocellatus]